MGINEASGGCTDHGHLSAFSGNMDHKHQHSLGCRRMVDLNKVLCGSMDHRHQYVTSYRRTMDPNTALSAVQATHINMVSGSNLDHEHYHGLLQ